MPEVGHPQNLHVAPVLHTLRNGLRLVLLPMPWRSTASLSVYVRAGSLHEPARLSGISHVVEHMAFKGTATRNCQRINLDAEQLGAEVNAHTDKDHTAFHIEGLARDVPAFVAQLADIVQHSRFPARELVREQAVILQEFAEVEEDPTAIVFQLIDSASYGRHAAARPVIGRRASVKALRRQDLMQYVQAHYTGHNLVVAAAGPIQPASLLAAVRAGFGALAPGQANCVPTPPWRGGLRVRHLHGSAQCHVAIAFEAPALADASHTAWVLAAAVLGEGMSSPLMDRVRERLGLAYHAGCAADILPHAGQFVIEAATAPTQAAALLAEISRLLAQHARRIDDAALARARHQIEVRMLRALEHPARGLESAAQDLFTFGRLRDPRQTLQQLQALDGEAVRAVFKRMCGQRAAVALVGNVPAAVCDGTTALFGV